MSYWHGYLSGARCKWFAHGPADATATPSSLASLKSRMIYLSGAGLPRLSWKKRPLNRCSSVVKLSLKLGFRPKSELDSKIFFKPKLKLTVVLDLV